ncbi:hypothetical protein ACRTEP_23590 [Vibrio diabolicus]|uniref:hypothetical protein n=1 Tax=Vibrio diabolicus TaxID=50719 RepID=UPI003D7E05F5
MRTIDKPLLWLYVKTRDSALSSMKGFSSLLLILVIWTIALGPEPSQSELVNLFSTLLALGLPLSIGLMILKYKFRNVGASIPKSGTSMLTTIQRRYRARNCGKRILLILLVVNDLFFVHDDSSRCFDIYCFGVRGLVQNS